MCHMALCKVFGIYPKPLPKDGDVVISLTSFPKRINDVWIAIDSMFYQKMKPSKVILNLTEEEFPNEKEGFPKRLLEYEKLGLEIRFRKENLFPHNKYFYALQEAGNKCVITIDDDMYYLDNLVSNLWSLHQAHPDCICANSVRKICFNNDGSFAPYKEWHRAVEPVEPSLLNLALGANGVLYPSNIFKDKSVFNVREIKELCLKADDLWLRMQEMRQGIKVVSGKLFVPGIGIFGSQAVSLKKSNVGHGKNDAQWQKLCERYGVDRSYFG